MEAVSIHQLARNVQDCLESLSSLNIQLSFFYRQAKISKKLYLKNLDRLTGAVGLCHSLQRNLQIVKEDSQRDIYGASTQLTYSFFSDRECGEISACLQEEFIIYAQTIYEMHSLNKLHRKWQKQKFKSFFLPFTLWKIQKKLKNLDRRIKIIERENRSLLQSVNATLEYAYGKDAIEEQVIGLKRELSEYISISESISKTLNRIDEKKQEIESLEHEVETLQKHNDDALSRSDLTQHLHNMSAKPKLKAGISDYSPQEAMQ